MIKFERATTRKPGSLRGRPATKPVQYKDIEPLKVPLRQMRKNKYKEQVTIVVIEERIPTKWSRIKEFLCKIYKSKRP